MNTKNLRGNVHRKSIKRSARKLRRAYNCNYGRMKLQRAVDQLVKSVKETSYVGTTA